MDLFGFKKRKQEKIEKRRKEEEEKLKEKEISTKIRIRKTLNDMKLQSSKLDGFKKDYIEKARQAALINNKQTYNLAKQGLKLCLSKQRFLDSMVANFEIALQMNEMNKVINGFVSGMNLIADEMKGVTSTIDIAKAQGEKQDYTDEAIRAVFEWFMNNHKQNEPAEAWEVEYADCPYVLRMVKK